MTPPPPELLVDGGKWWKRYPSEFTTDFSEFAYLSELHQKHLDPDHFVVLGSARKASKERNRRTIDMNVVRFELDTGNDVSRDLWGLPTPNRPAAYMSLGKYGRDCPAINGMQARYLDEAAEWMTRHFGPYMTGARVRSVEEAIGSLDRTTSPGFPWTRKYRTKGDMLDTWPQLSGYLSEDWERLVSNDYVSIYGNSLKEEIRLLEKIETNSLRTFTAGPVEMTVHGNRLFEDMNQRFYQAHLVTASTVGFSPLKGGWARLIDKLERHPTGFALDEKAYDASLYNFFLWACAEFRWSCLAEEDQTSDNLARCKVYYQNLVHTTVVTSEGVFVRKQGGNPSGSVNTIVDNTLVLFMLLSYAWLRLAPIPMKPYGRFMEHTSLALCGDDNTWTVSDEALSFFNAAAVIKVWSEFGITTTTDSLVAKLPVELDFLSAHTVFIDGVAVPLYSRSKMLTSLLYAEDKSDPTTTLMRACCIMQNAWTDPEMRRYLRQLVSWLLARFDHVLCNDEAWIVAKTMIMTDAQLRRLVLGERVFRPGGELPQSRSTGIKIPPPTAFFNNQSMSNNGPTPAQRRQQSARDKALYAIATRSVRTPSPRKVGGGKRWGISLGEASLGPVRIKGLSAGSTNNGGKRNQTRTVGVGVASANPQRVMPRISSVRRNTGVQVDILTGTDLVCTVTSPNVGKAPGYILCQQEISPSKILGTRLHQFSGMYQRYRFNKVTFIYDPIANTTQSGQLLGFCDFDAAVPLEQEDANNLHIAAAHQGQAICQIWEKQTFSMSQSRTFTDLFVDDLESDDPRLSVQGVFYLLTASDMPESIPLGNIYMSYEIEYSIPNLTLSPSIAGMAASSAHADGFLKSLQGFDTSWAPSAFSNFETSGGMLDYTITYRSSIAGVTFNGLVPGRTYRVALETAISAPWQKALDDGDGLVRGTYAAFGGSYFSMVAPPGSQNFWNNSTAGILTMQFLGEFTAWATTQRCEFTLLALEIPSTGTFPISGSLQIWQSPSSTLATKRQRPLAAMMARLAALESASANKIQTGRSESDAESEPQEREPLPEKAQSTLFPGYTDSPKVRAVTKLSRP